MKPITGHFSPTSIETIRFHNFSVAAENTMGKVYSFHLFRVGNTRQIIFFYFSSEEESYWP